MQFLALKWMIHELDCVRGSNNPVGQLILCRYASGIQWRPGVSPPVPGVISPTTSTSGSPAGPTSLCHGVTSLRRRRHSQTTLYACALSSRGPPTRASPPPTSGASQGNAPLPANEQALKKRMGLEKTMLPNNALKISPTEKLAAHYITSLEVNS